MAERGRPLRGGFEGRSTDRGRRDWHPSQREETGPIDEGYSADDPSRYALVEEEPYDVDRDYVETRWGERELAPGWGWGPMKQSTRGYPGAGSLRDEDDDPIRFARGTIGRGAAYGYDGESAVMRPGELEEEGLVPLAGEYRGRGPKNWRRSDERIREDVCRAMTEHPQLDCSDVQVDVEDGEVILSGTIRERRLKRLAEDIAYDVPGVVDVLNEIRIRRQSSPTLSREDER